MLSFDIQYISIYSLSLCVHVVGQIRSVILKLNSGQKASLTVNIFLCVFLPIENPEDLL